MSFGCCRRVNGVVFLWYQDFRLLVPDIFDVRSGYPAAGYGERLLVPEVFDVVGVP